MCSLLNLQIINNVYTTSPRLSSYDTVSSFTSNIIKKVPVTSNYGYMVFDPGMATSDFLDCSNQPIKTRELHIKDVKGQYINLHNAHITFSIVCNKYNAIM